MADVQTSATGSSINITSQRPTALFHASQTFAHVHVVPCTSRLWQPPPVDLILHHVGPVQQAAAEVEVQGDGVPQARHQQAVISLVQIYPSYLVTDGENDKSLEGI